MEKKCNRCNTIKPYTEFHIRRASSDGLDNACKICRQGTNYGRNTKLEQAPDKDRIPAESILRGLGFELYNDKDPVYLQFNRRIALKYGIILGDIKKGS